MLASSASGSAFSLRHRFPVRLLRDSVATAAPQSLLPFSARILSHDRPLSPPPHHAVSLPRSWTMRLKVRPSASRASRPLKSCQRWTHHVNIFRIELYPAADALGYL